MFNKILNNNNTDINLNIHTNIKTNTKTNTSLSSITPQLIHLVSKLNKVGIYSLNKQTVKKNSSKLTNRVTKLKYIRSLKEIEVKQNSLSSLIKRYMLESKVSRRGNLLRASKELKRTKRFEFGKAKSLKLKFEDKRLSLKTINFLTRYNPLLKKAAVDLKNNTEVTVNSGTPLRILKKQKLIAKINRSQHLQKLYLLYLKQSRKQIVKYLPKHKFLSLVKQTAYEHNRPLFSFNLITKINPIYKNNTKTKLLIKDSLTLPDNLKNKITYFNGYKTPISNWKPIINWLESPIKIENLLPTITINKFKNSYKSFYDLNYHYLENKYNLLKLSNKIKFAYPKTNFISIDNNQSTNPSILNLYLGENLYNFNKKSIQKLPFFSFKPLGIWSLTQDTINNESVDLNLKTSSELFNLISNKKLYKNTKLKYNKFKLIVNKSNPYSTLKITNRININPLTTENFINNKIIFVNKKDLFKTIKLVKLYKLANISKILKFINTKFINLSILSYKNKINSNYYREMIKTVYIRIFKLQRSGKQLRLIFKTLVGNKKKYGKKQEMKKIFRLIKSLKRTNSLTIIKLRELLIKLIRDYISIYNLIEKDPDYTNSKYFFKKKKLISKVLKAKLFKFKMTQLQLLQSRINRLVLWRKGLKLKTKIKASKIIKRKKLEKKKLGQEIKNMFFLKSRSDKINIKPNLNFNLSFFKNIKNINNNNNNSNIYFNILNNYKVQNLSKFNYSNLKISLIKLKLQLIKLSKLLKAKKQSAIKFSQILRLHKSKRKIRNLLIRNSLIKLLLSYNIRKKSDLKKKRNESWKDFLRKVKKFKLTQNFLKNKQETKIIYNKLTYNIRKSSQKFILTKIKRKNYKFHNLASLNRLEDDFLFFKGKNLNLNLNNYKINPISLNLLNINNKYFKANNNLDFKTIKHSNKLPIFNSSFINNKIILNNNPIKISFSNQVFFHYFNYCLDYSNKFNFNQFNLIYSKLENLIKTQVNNKFVPFIFKNYLNNIYFQRKIIANEIFLLKALNFKIESKKQMITDLLKAQKLDKVANKENTVRLNSEASKSLITKFNNSYNRENSKYLNNLSQLYLNILTPINDKTLLPKSKKQNIKYKYYQFISYNFNKYSNDGNYLSDRMFKNINKLLNAFFKSIYCLISKPTFVITPEKITIKLFYFICLPDLGEVKKSTLYKMFTEKLIVNSNYFKYLYLEWGKNLNTINLINKHELNKFNFYNHNKIKKKILNRFNIIFKTQMQIKPKSLNKKFNNQFFLAELKNNKKYKKSKFFFKNLTLLSKVNIAQSFPKKFSTLTKYLSKLFNKTVEFELTRLYKPNLDSNILASTLNILLNKKRSYFEFIENIYDNTKLVQLDPYNLAKVKNKKIAVLTGLNIKVAGRLPGQPIIPKVTVKSHTKGISAQGKVNFLDVAKITNKNKMGSFTITISTGQKLM